MHISTCRKCGKQFKVKGARIGIFCTKACHDASMFKPVSKCCKVCGKSFTVRPCEAKRINTCSRRCCRLGKLADGNSNWRGGKAQTERKLLIGRSEYKRWKAAVLKHDGNACVACGSTKRLQAHHIKPWAWFPSLRYKVSNGQTLCRDCHRRETHHLFSLQPEQYQYAFRFGKFGSQARTCPWCDKRFTSSAHNARFCSKRCCGNYNAAKLRAWSKAVFGNTTVLRRRKISELKAMARAERIDEHKP